MNEIFLIVLIAVTCMSFIKLNRRIGASAIFPGTFIPNREQIYYEDDDLSTHHSNMSEAIISAKGNWSATTTYENVQENIMFVYHHRNNVELVTPPARPNSRIYTQITGQDHIEYL